MAKQLGVPLITSDFAFESGGIDTNGNGTFLIIRQMALQRNPTKTLEQIEAELTRTLGARKIIWLEQGLIEDRRFPRGGPFYRNYDGGGANMHVDELARFVNDTTVILPYIAEAEKNRSPIDSLNYPIFEANASILEQATTADGKKLTIVLIPMSEAERLKFTVKRLGSCFPIERLCRCTHWASTEAVAAFTARRANSLHRGDRDAASRSAPPLRTAPTQSTWARGPAPVLVPDLESPDQECPRSYCRCRPGNRE